MLFFHTAGHTPSTRYQPPQPEKSPIAICDIYSKPAQ